ncbi:hypothetical protein GA0115246_114583 [Streptomyces sp. SolWspMP-sol7th]|nr:hypothetical protein GA0115246_114583 [Streptomyces sp. SolWspMP-sol7th]
MGQRPGTRAAAPAGDRARRAGHAPLPGGDGPRHVPRQQRELPDRLGEAAQSAPPPDPPRHPAQAHGPGPDALPGRRARAGLPAVAAPHRQVGLQPHLEPALDAHVAPRLPLRVHRAGARLPAQRRVLHGRSGPGAGGADAARHRARGTGRALRADAPRLRERVAPPARPRTPHRTPGPRHGVARARALLLLVEPERAGRAARDPPGARRLRVRAGGGTGPRGRRARHGLLVDHVRLRAPGPPDRGLRRRLGDLPGHARRLLRPHGAAPGRGRPHRGRADGDPRGRRVARHRRADGARRLPGAVLRLRRRARRRTRRPARVPGHPGRRTPARAPARGAHPAPTPEEAVSA